MGGRRLLPCYTGGMLPLSIHRRAFVKWAAAAPVLATIAGRAIVQRAAAATGAEPSIDVYRRIGVRPFINARGTWTYLSGSLELPEVRRAMDAAAHHFVDMFELQRAVGKRLAELSGAESGMVTSGAAGAMAAATAACIAGADPEKIWNLPDTTGLKHEVVMLGGRSAFDNAIRLAGAKLVMAHHLDDLRPAITENTAMVYTTWRDDRLEKALAVTRAAQFRCCWMTPPAFRPSRTCPATPKRESICIASAAEKDCADRSARDCCWAGKISSMPLSPIAARGKVPCAAP